MKRTVNIHVGELFAAAEPTVISTVLGSCVSVCLFDPVRSVGGMNHILLPGRDDLGYFSESARYGMNAMELLINRMFALGARRDRLQAKIFGGATILLEVAEAFNTGDKNVHFVTEYLRVEGIPLLGGDTGGGDSRRIYFHTDTFEVYLKRIATASFREVAAEERSYARRIRRELGRTDEITLFDQPGRQGNGSPAPPSRGGDPRQRKP
jgi:chemotaxis protein CheD